MKPANEIVIKRNVYTFSGLVLVLSVLIGSSAWTFRSGARAQSDITLRQLEESLVKHMNRLQELDVVYTVLFDSIQDLNHIIASMSQDEWRDQLTMIKDFIGSANGKTGEDLKDHVSDKGEFQGELDWDPDTYGLLKETRSCLRGIGSTSARTEKALDIAERKSGGPTTERMETQENASAPPVDPCAEQEDRIDDLKNRLHKISVARESGLKALAEDRRILGLIHTNPSILYKPTEEALQEAIAKQAYGNTKNFEEVWRQYYNLLQVVKGKTQGIQ